MTNLVKEQPDHAKRMADFAVEAVEAANHTLVDQNNPDLGHVDIRLGIHSGPCVSNVVGSRSPRFCLFGDTVNTAGTIERLSFPNRIHCSERSAKLMTRQSSKHKLLCRGLVSLQGKGEMTTYWVNDDSLSAPKEEPQDLVKLYSEFEW